MSQIKIVKSKLQSPWFDTTESKNFIKKLLQKHCLYKMPIDLERLAKLEGFKIFYHTDKDCEGYIYISKIKPFEHDNQKYSKIISLNTNQSSTRQRFTLAHELAHYFLDYDEYKNEPFFEKRDEDEHVFNFSSNETIMNNFASELLMPFEMIDTFVKMAQDDFSELVDISNPALISTIAKSFNVSNSVAKVRLDKLKRGF